MSDDVYRKLATVLDTLPNGFPAKENDAGIKLLERIFTPDQAELFCDLRLQFESAEEIAERTGRPLEGLEDELIGMRDKGQIWGIKLGDAWIFKMVPWAFGIYEFQLPHLDKEFAELNEQFYPSWGKQFFQNTPQMMQSLTIEEEIPVTQEALPYEKVSTIIENGQSFLLNQCICKKEQGLLGKPCDRPLEVCLAIAPVPDVFKDSPVGRVITKKEAYELLDKCEENALVHLTGNTQQGHFFICNCCGCCCGVLRGINELGVPASSTIHSNYYAEIDVDECIDCGICADERCQVNAISASEEAAYHVFQEKCIGCGLCVSACPTDAIKMLRKPEERVVTPPQDETEWFKQRGSRRGVDFSRYE